MKKSLQMLIVFAFLGLNANAQLTFQKTYGGRIGNGDRVMQITSDGGYIIAGGIDELGLIKTDKFGDTLWTKSYAITNYSNQVYSVQQTLDKGYILIGLTWPISWTWTENVLIKTDSLGGIIWVRGFPTSDGYNDDLSSILQTNDGGYAFAGNWIENINGDVGSYFFKTDSNGVVLWQVSGNVPGWNTGYFKSIEKTNDNGYVITGLYGGNNSSGANLIKIDSSGNFIWSHLFNPGIPSYSLGMSVRQTNDGGFIIAGNTSDSGFFSQVVYLIKTDTGGNFVWSKTYGGIRNDVANSVEQTTDGGYILVGKSNSFTADSNYDVYLIKTDSQGNLIWSRTYGDSGDENGYSVHQTDDGGYIIGASSYSFGNEGIYVIKTDFLGNEGCNEFVPSTIVSTPASNTSTDNSYNKNNGFSPYVDTLVVGSGGTQTTICIHTGINEISQTNNISIYPNPASTLLNIHYSTYTSQETLLITDLLGTEVYKEELHGIDNTISISKWSNGVYFYEVRGEKESVRGKFVVQK